MSQTYCVKRMNPSLVSIVRTDTCLEHYQVRGAVGRLGSPAELALILRNFSIQNPFGIRRHQLINHGQFQFRIYLYAHSEARF